MAGEVARRMAESTAESLHAEVAALHRTVSELVARATPAASDVAHEIELRDRALAELARIARRPVPGELRKRFERLRTRLERLSPGSPDPARAREIAAEVELFERADWADQLLSRSLAALSGIGEKRAEAFARRGLERISDLLFWLPSSYEDRRELSRVSELKIGRRFSFEAEVKAVDWVGQRRGGRFGRILQALVGDDGDVIQLKWFRGGETVASRLVKGRRVLVSGEVTRYRFSKELIHPEVELLPDREAGAREDASADASAAVAAARAGPAELGRIVPVYATPEGR